MSKKEDIVLSICVISFNHEKYILDTLNGIFNQKFNFNCELVIFDDCSTDFTKKIILNYLNEKKSNFVSVKFNVNRKNIGLSQNFYNALKSCRGKYIAICEGDDYWIDNYKIQKQIDFLVKNTKFVICYHYVKILNNNLISDDFHNSKNIPNESSYNDLLCYGNYIQTCSVVFLNLVHDFPYNKLNQLNDYILWFWLSQFGDIFRLRDKMSVYREGSGVWSVLNNEQKKLFTLNSLIQVNKITKNDNDKSIIHFRIQSLKFSLLPVELQSNNSNQYDLINYLSTNVSILDLFKSLIAKLFNRLKK